MSHTLRWRLASRAFDTPFLLRVFVLTYLDADIILSVMLDARNRLTRAQRLEIVRVGLRLIRADLSMLKTCYGIRREISKYGKQ